MCAPHTPKWAKSDPHMSLKYVDTVLGENASCDGHAQHREHAHAIWEDPGGSLEARVVQCCPRYLQYQDFWNPVSRRLRLVYVDLHEWR